MKELNTYILEKLHLKKGIKSVKTLAPDDEFGILSLYFNNARDFEVVFEIRRPYIIEKIDDKVLTYKSSYGRGFDVSYYVNSKGYYQYDEMEINGKNKGRIFRYWVFLNVYEYKEILQLLLKEKVFNPKYKEEAEKKIKDILVKDYFDNINMSEFNKKELIFYDLTSGSVVSVFERPKELKDVINTYYNN